MARAWYAPDLARDLGWPDAVPAFWAWVRACGLRPLPDKPYAFDLDDVADAIREAPPVAIPSRREAAYPRAGRLA